MFIERIKKNEYAGHQAQYYFWRNYQEAEVDFLEKFDSSLSAFEFKWTKKRYSTPKFFKETYNLEVEVINRDNYQKFIA